MNENGTHGTILKIDCFIVHYNVESQSHRRVACKTEEEQKEEKNWKLKLKFR